MNNTPIEHFGYSPQDFAKFKRYAWRYLLMFSFLYCTLYCCRLNLSNASAVMMSDLGWTKSDIGILTGTLFWTYGIGQIVNGRLSEIVGPTRFVFFAVLLSAATNIVFSFQTSILAMAALWGLNGFFQSMAWTPGIAALTKWWPGNSRGFATGFANAFWNTAAFAVVSIVLINVVAFMIAFALTHKMKGSNLFRTVFFMPNLIGGVVLGYIWSMIFDGILKAYSTYLTANPTYGFWGLVILVAWQQIGYMMIIYIAGLQAVPEDMMEAARIDGANGAQTLFHVTIPNVMPSITICTFLTLTNSFKMFDQNLALTGGLPQIVDKVALAKINTTELLALNIYSTYNINKNYHGVAQAKAVIFFILVAILALSQQAATRSKEVQQ